MKPEIPHFRVTFLSTRPDVTALIRQGDFKTEVIGRPWWVAGEVHEVVTDRAAAVLGIPRDEVTVAHYTLEIYRDPEM